MLDKTVLQDLYVKQEKSLQDIAKICGVYPVTILDWMKKYDLPRRNCGPLTQSIRERIKIKIDIDTNGCWNWTGTIDSNGYGRLRSQGKIYYAHRISYEFLVGEIPEGLTIDHLCRNRRCINPNHLEVVTMRENTLRGEGPTAYKAKQVYCIRGHLLFGENLYATPQGKRQCKECNRMRQKRSI